VNIQYWILTRLRAPQGGKWLMRWLGVAFIAFAVIWIAPRYVDSFRASHGIQGVIQVDQCSGRDGGSRHPGQQNWTCTGSFAGDDGTRIPDITLIDVLQKDAPASGYVAMVASPDSTTAHPLGNAYNALLVPGVALIASGSLFLYWSFGGRRWRGKASAGPPQG